MELTATINDQITYQSEAGNNTQLIVTLMIIISADGLAELINKSKDGVVKLRVVE